ncbi:Transcriptional corepressor SEUSS [Zea mays]|uniref:Transcriptional corepressor SEUSS n=1 Tax=Zea mays TaxID=4577 RepID=A0A1D6F5A5_MAIZE|nr:Transcriptional corepressor SEUSS [Zea mays]
MMPSGPPNPMGHGQPVGGAAPSLLRTSSSLLSGGGQPGMGGGGGGMLSSQSPFSSLVSPRTQFGGNGLLGGASLLNRPPFGNGGPMPGPGSMQAVGMQMSTLQQRAGLDGASDFISAEGSDPLSFPSSSQVNLGNQMGSDNLQATSQQQQQQMDAMQDMQQQLPMSYNQQQLPPQHSQQLQQPQATVKLENGGSMISIKPEQQMAQPDQMMRSASGVKLEPQQLQAQMMRSLSSVKMEQQTSDSSAFLQQQQQQQHLLQLTKQIRNCPELVSIGGPNAIANPQAATAAQLTLLQQQRLLHMQQQQQQQILKNLPLQRNQLQQQQQHQQQQQLLRQQSLNMRTPGKSSPYEPGTCAKRLTHYMYHQQNRPQDNNIEYWRNFVNEYFAPNAKKRWCVSLYGSGRQTTGVFPQDVWHCEICNRKPGRGFETTVEVLPRLCQIKYASGTLEELLYIDMPRESQNTSGQIILDYTKAIQESVFEQLRVVREGHLRIVFNPDLKIASWEFCARRHEELVPRRSIIPQVSNLGAAVQKYQAATQNSTSLSAQDMQNNCNSALEVPLVNDLGYTKRYVRCLQIAEVVNCMKDLIDHSRQTGSGPIDSLHNLPRRTPSGASTLQPQQQQTEEKQAIPQSSNQSGQNSAPMAGVQPSASANGDVTSNVTLSCAPSTSAPSPSVVGLLQNSMNSRQDHAMSSNNGGPYSGGNVAIPKVNSTSSLHSNPPTSFPSPAPTTSNNSMMPAPQNTNQLSSPTTSPSIPPMQPPAARPQEAEPSDSQSSVQKILQDLMSSQMNGVGHSGNDTKTPNGLTHGANGVNCLLGNAAANNSGIGGMGFGAMSGFGHGMRTAMANNPMAMGARMGMNHGAHDLSQLGQLQHQQQHQQQHDIGSQLLGGFRSGNSFNNMQYDWKPSQ